MPCLLAAKAGQSSSVKLNELMFILTFSKYRHQTMLKNGLNSSYKKKLPKHYNNNNNTVALQCHSDVHWRNNGVGKVQGPTSAGAPRSSKKIKIISRYSKNRDIWISNTRMFYCNTSNIGSVWASCARR